ncbi:MAG TPA: hypothetical protein VLK65_17140 [Vicinamibacteria bacterium]|nr:hypothetical protein [Vicinamibacteria bacterium]
MACEEPDASGETRAIPPSAAPYVGTLAFQSDRAGNWDIYRIDADGTNLRPLTQHPAADQNPAWSPDGRSIVFSSERTGAGDIYVMDANGGNVTRLTFHEAYEGAPRFSPDGRRIVFEGERDGVAQIYLLDRDTGDVRRLSRTRSRKLGPAFSPDNEWLAYMEKGLLSWHVTISNVEGGNRNVVTEGSGSCRPAWSPDGSLLAYVSTRDSPKADVWLREMAGRRAGEAWKVSSRPDAHNYDPAFSPDGAALAIASTSERGAREQWDLYLVDLNGRNLVRLSGEEGNERFPTWRPGSGTP